MRMFGTDSLRQMWLEVIQGRLQLAQSKAEDALNTWLALAVVVFALPPQNWLRNWRVTKRWVINASPFIALAKISQMTIYLRQDNNYWKDRS
jgi:hypothetical protein